MDASRETPHVTMLRLSQHTCNLLHVQIFSVNVQDFKANLKIALNDNTLTTYTEHPYLLGLAQPTATSYCWHLTQSYIVILVVIRVVVSSNRNYDNDNTNKGNDNNNN